MRSFALDAMEAAAETGKAAKQLAKGAVQEFVGQGYGIFSGDQVQWATLRFSPERARWVGREVWHPKQKMRVEKDGHLVLEVPFTDARELMMDVLRHGAQVEAVGPKFLRDALIKELKNLTTLYGHD